MKLLFEPWNLGDAIIAASVARLIPGRITLACNSSWHEVLTLASGDTINLLPLDLPYVWRSGKTCFSLSKAASSASAFNPEQLRSMEVICIRGDLRDWIAAHLIFRGADFTFTGWLPFCARKSSVLDLPFKLGYLEVRNRYRAWAEAAGIPYSVLEEAYSVRPAIHEAASIVIHVGAQWLSKQYPHVAELVRLLNNSGFRVTVLAGPNDPLPPGVTNGMVQRPGWPDLVAHLRNARFVVTNDSGPLHLAAYLGCRTLALSRCSNILEWLPPGVTALSSSSAPRGYRPIPDYWSDRVLPDWPSPAQVMTCLNARLETPE